VILGLRPYVWRVTFGRKIKLLLDKMPGSSWHNGGRLNSIIVNIHEYMIFLNLSIISS
jgi:hypothetical protein